LLEVAPDRHACSLPPAFLLARHVSSLQALPRPAVGTHIYAPLAALYCSACRRPCIAHQLVQAALYAVAGQRVHERAKGRTVGIFDNPVVSRSCCWSELAILQQKETLMTFASLAVSLLTFVAALLKDAFPAHRGE
jgi:hypothetical protein